MPMAIDRWNDDRLDDLAGQLRSMSPLPVQVATLTSELQSVKRELVDPEGAVPRLNRKLEQITGNPIAEGRQLRQGSTIAAASVLGTAVVTVLIFVATGAIK